ncbi:hypothetical protein vseg_011278 [Gypsophila vaccaria]
MTSTKIKGICKGSFKYISHFFVVKERELEIGSPTDVKHVAHIGWDGPDGTSPSWMNDYKGSTEVAIKSVGSIGGSRDPTWSSQDFEHTLRQQSSGQSMNFPPGNAANMAMKSRRKKTNSTTSSPKTSSARTSRSSKPKSMLSDSEEANSRRSLRL